MFKKFLILPALALALSGSAMVAAHGGLNTHKKDGQTVASSKRQNKERSAANGETKERYHDATACALPSNVTSLPGNWTHGQYVSAWATTGDHDKTKTAAKSDCGKPVKATGEHGKSEEDHGKSNEDHGKSNEEHGEDQEDDNDEINALEN